MTKLISALIVLVVVFCGYQVYQHWEQVKNAEELQKKAEAEAMNPARLPGMPGQLEQVYQQAAQKGPDALRAFLKTYDSHLQDPRRAWIELELCVAITREDPAEARRMFKAVKERTPADSPIQPRIKELQRSYE